MAIRDSRAFRFLNRPEVLTIIVCAAWLGSGFVPEQVRSTVCGTAYVAILLIALIAGFSSAGACKQRLRHLKAHHAQVEDGYLVQRDARLKKVGAVDLSRPFDVSIPFAGNGEGVYRVTQGESSVEISSHFTNAEHLVRGVLKLRTWPPDAKMNWP